MAFTDYFDNPITAGDEVVYVCSYGSSVRLCRVTVDAVVPLVPHPDSSKTGILVREDHAQKKDPAKLRHFYSSYSGKPVPAEHRFVLVVRERQTWGDRKGELGNRRAIENIRNVIVVPKGA